MSQDQVPLAVNHHDVPPLVTQKDETDLILSRFFDILFPAAVTFGGLALVISIYRSLHHGWHLALFLNITMYISALIVLTLRHRIPVRLKFCFFLGLVSVSIIHSFITMGLAGEGMMSLAVLYVFAGVFLGIRAGIITIIIGMSAVSIIGTLICTGIIRTSPDILTLLSEPVTWAVQITLVLLYVVPLVLIIHYMQKRITESLAVSRNTNEQLQEEIRTRIAAENELRDSEAKYRGVVENSLVAFYVIQDELFRFVNARFCAITGYPYDEIIDTLGPLDLTHPDDRKKVGKIIRYHLRGNSTENEYEVKIAKKDGTATTVKVQKNSIIYNGRPAYFGTAVDITKERILEAKLLHAQKMESIGTLTGGIAHDFNNILTALTGYGTLLQMKMKDTDPLRRYADHILSASEKAADLTKSLLAFSRLQPVALKSININTVVQGTEPLLRRLISEDIILETALAPGQINVIADHTQIDQILFNLVVNARDAMPKGGVLKIRTEITELDEKFILANGFGKEGRYALLSVSDNGIGMDEPIRQKIFEPFFTTKEPGKGTGLGLSTVYGIVKQHYGYISIRSEAGQGSDFHIYLPLVNADVLETQKSHADFREGNETILVADDNYEVRSYIKDILGEHGYRIIEAMDGDDAINKFRENREVSLVILDSVMPKRNGKDVYDSMEKMRPGVRALFMSGYPKEVVLAKGVIEDCAEFISKPLSADNLLKKVRKILDRQGD